MGRIKPRCGWEGAAFVFRSADGYYDKITRIPGADRELFRAGVREDLKRWRSVATNPIDIANLDAALRAEGIETAPLHDPTTDHLISEAITGAAGGGE